MTITSTPPCLPHLGLRRAADALTWLRLALAAPIAIALLSSEPGLASLLFVIAAATDYLDGRIARASGAPSGFGVQLDPIADKLLVLTTLCALWAQGALDISATIALLVILAREIAVTALRIARSASHRPFGASVLAKAKTAVQMAAVAVLLGSQALPTEATNLRAFGTMLLIGAALLSVSSGVVYLQRHTRP